MRKTTSYPSSSSDALSVDTAGLQKMLNSGRLIIPGLSEPPVRTLRATIPENGSHIFR